MRILLVEDNKKLAHLLSNFLEEKGYSLHTAYTLREAKELIARYNFSAIISDLKLPDGEGTDLLEEAKHNSIPIIFITAYGTIPSAVEAIKKGAYDFIQKPVDPEHLELVLRKCLEEQKVRRSNLAFKEEFARRYSLPEIVGKHPSFLRALEEMKKAAPTDVTILLLGESGTGKELFARAIHLLSPRREGPFVAINCASIPDNLLESELFGYEKGAFTGAYTSKKGKIEIAHGGTLFLDEIAEMSTSLQAKLLRVIEEKKFERVGGTRTIEVDVRIVVATNRDLQKEVEKGNFREDLFFRISVFPIKIPPLRERKGDIPLLAEYFAKKAAEEMKVPISKISKEAMEKLLKYYWPGNVRELKNVIERAVILSEGREIEASHIVLLSPKRDELDLSGTLEEAVDRAVQWVERKKIQQAIEESEGDINRAAEKLGISPKTLYSKMRKYNISRHEF